MNSLIEDIRNIYRESIEGVVAAGDREREGDDPWWAIALAQEKRLPAVRPNNYHGATTVPIAPDEATKIKGDSDPFTPKAPQSLNAVGVSPSQIEALILKFLASQATATGRRIAQQIKLPFGLIHDLLRGIKEDRLVVYKSTSAMGDYVYELTEAGFARARRFAEQCTYFGATPVPLEQYAAGVCAQSVRAGRARMSDLRRAFADLVLGDELLAQLGQAINSGLGLFLYGSPGNGKTSIAERITRTMGESIWIPRAISVLGEIIRVYDPTCHEALPDAPPGAPLDACSIDHRWIRIRRPTLVVGGELTLDNLEVSSNRLTGISEAPLQVKSNGGTLVIDDFGRQRVTPAELLNRWIVPLEKRYDFLNLASGRKVQVPFDQLIIFSTNLEPRDLVDEAFLRRIPYKIDVSDPTEAEFRLLFERTAEAMEIGFDGECLDYLLERHYRASGRGLRFCHARDLLHQVRVYCDFQEQPAVLGREAIDAAVKNYFAMM
ncbi:MAG: AAA family ATPase [Pirellulales bacterium]|nr:AAA family ATPase [Pirellulales bacterium]